MEFSKRNAARFSHLHIKYTMLYETMQHETPLTFPSIRFSNES